MQLLAGGITRGEALTVIVLCIITLILILFNVILIISLHKGNKRLVKRAEASAEEKIPEEDENNQIDINKHNI